MMRRVFSSLSMVVVGVGCAFFTHLLLAKNLGAEEYGVFSFIFSLSLLIGVFSLFGFQNAAVKIIAVFQGKNESENKTRPFMRFATFFSLIVSVIAAAIIYGGLSLTEYTAQYPKQVLFLGCALTPLMVFMRLNAAFLRGFSKSTLSVLYETTLREILFLGLIILSIVTAVQFNSGFDTLLLLFAALFIATTASWFHARYYYNKQPAVEKVSEEDKKKWITTALPMMFIIFAQRLLRRCDIIILGLMVHPALVGAYAIAAQFSEVGAIGQKGIFAVFSPKAAALYESKKTDQLKKTYHQMQFIGIAVTGVICVSIGIAAPYILQFFGDGYNAAYTALLILMAGQFINICFGPVGILMIMTGREKRSMRLTMMAAAGNLIFNPPAIYFYGLDGAAIVTSFFLVLRGLLSYLDVKKQRIL